MTGDCSVRARVCGIEEFKDGTLDKCAPAEHDIKLLLANSVFMMDVGLWEAYLACLKYVVHDNDCP